MKHALLSLSNSKIISWAFKLGFTLAAFWLALRNVDIVHVIEILEEQRHDGLVITVALLLAQVTLGALRWHTIIGAIVAAGEKMLTRLETIKIYYISVFFNCCLPGTVGGDVVRVWLIKSDHISLHTAINSVIIDRLIALLALAVLVIATLPGLAEVAGFNVHIWLPVLLLVGATGFWLTLRMRPFLARFEHRRPARWLLHFVNCLHLLIARPRTSFIALIYSIFSHLGFCFCVYALAMGLNVDITILQCITLVPLVMLAMTMPISVGGWGVREVSMVGMLGLVGVPPAAALMIALEYGLINIVTCLPAAVLWLAYRKNKRGPVTDNLHTA